MLESAVGLRLGPSAAMAVGHLHGAVMGTHDMLCLWLGAPCRLPSSELLGEKRESQAGASIDARRVCL